MFFYAKIKMGCGCEKKRGSGVRYHRHKAIMKRGSGRGKKRKRVASGVSFRGSGIIMTGAGVSAKRARKTVSNGRVHI